MTKKQDREFKSVYEYSEGDDTTIKSTKKTLKEIIDIYNLDEDKFTKNGTIGFPKNVEEFIKDNLQVFNLHEAEPIIDAIKNLKKKNFRPILKDTDSILKKSMNYMFFSSAILEEMDTPHKVPDTKLSIDAPENEMYLCNKQAYSKTSNFCEIFLYFILHIMYKYWRLKNLNLLASKELKRVQVEGGTIELEDLEFMKTIFDANENIETSAETLLNSMDNFYEVLQNSHKEINKQLDKSS